MRMMSDTSDSGKRQTVLVVDDEPGIVELMRDFLETDGFAVRSARNGAEALAALTSGPVDCILLDIMMPGVSGFELMRGIRAQTDAPVLFLTARDGASDKIRGLRLGADDYIVKSATPDEIVARVHAVLRRYQSGGSQQTAADEGVFDFGRLMIDTRAHEVRLDGQPVAMPAREFALLRLFAEHPRQVLSRDQLFELCWESFGDRSTVTTHIRRIREKIEEDPNNPRLLVTVWGVGYRFEGAPR
jgi:DNA-binding response OmpR family regulator